ncbi:MAG: EpsG family protein [Muribaculaceae bacterium]|nr:EpsG family protein [Muribaculaceae bacterium]
MIYLLIALLLLSFIYQYDIKGKTVNKTFCYNTILIALTLVAGLRYRLGVDTTAYLDMFYHEIPYLWNLTSDDFSITSEPLWVLMNSIVRSFGGRWYIVQLIQAAFVNVLVFKYFAKHSKYIFTCAFLYFFWMYHFYTMEEMRASISVVICLYSYDYFLERKWGRGYVLMFIACLFHRSSFALLITPLLIPLLQSNIACLIFLIVAFVGSYIIKSGLSDYISLIELANEDIESKMTFYANSDIYGESSGNINYFIGKIFPFMFYPIYALYYNKERYLAKIKPMLILGLGCLLVYINIVIAYRYVHFYACYIIIYIAQLMIELIKHRGINKTYNGTILFSLNLAKTCIIFFPFFFLLLYTSHKSNYDIYCYPYSSVIERNIDIQREQIYNSFGYPPPKQNEY